MAAALCTTAANAQVITEPFDSGTVPPAGWSQQNLSTPPGTNPTWFNGNAGVFTAQAGASYAAANFNAVGGNNIISMWMFSPVTTIAPGGVITFWTRTVPSVGFPDRLQVRISTAGSSTNVGATNTSVGDFSTLVLDINPTYTLSGYPNTWTLFTINLTAAQVPVQGTGRIAFRYFVEGGGPAGANSDYIGVDTFAYNPPSNNCLQALPAQCPANVNISGGSANQVDVADLLTVITNWGLTGPPRPVGDCAPLPNGDCTVNVGDLLSVITAWGSCTPPTGSCCIQGACSVLTQAACTSGGGTWGTPNSTCTGVNCPITNDECSGALTLVVGVSPGNPADNLGNNATATTPVPGTYPAPTCQSSITRDVWYKHVVPTTPGLLGQTLRLSTCTGTTGIVDSVLQAYTGTCGAGLVALACSDDSCGTLSEVTTNMVNPGTTVYIRLGSWSTGPTNQGAFNLRALVTNITSDTCSGAKNLAIGGSDTDTLDSATQDFGPQCENYPGQSIVTSCAPNPTPFSVSAGVGKWYKTVGNGHRLTASTCTSATGLYDGRISVYCGPDCGSLFCVQAVDCDTGNAQVAPCTAYQGETLSWCSTLGQDYYILVHAANVPTGQINPFTITLTDGVACTPTGIVCGPPPPPANDECAGAITIPVGATNFNNASATPTVPIAWCGTTGGKDVWFKYTSNNGGTVKIQITGVAPYTDGIATVYTGACASLVQVICVDDPVTGGTCTGCGACHPCIEFTATAGTTYTIQVGSWNAGGAGAGTITVTDP